MESEKKGSKLARRQKHSTLTASKYYPKPEAYSANYCGVFVDGEPYLLFLCSGDDKALRQAKSLAVSPNFRTLLEATSTSCDTIDTQHLNGRDLDWTREHTVISASRSGDLETGTRALGEIKAILMSGSHQAVADTLCIDGALASLIDSGFPPIESFDALPDLSDHDVKLSLGNLAARKLTWEQH